jgi:pyrrolidone-carboxylate peptidase
VVGLELPVSYAAAADALGAAIARHDPAAVIATGVARDPDVRLETRARNRVTSMHADNDGAVWTGRDLEPGGPTWRSARWDAVTLADGLSSPAIRVRCSDDAGGYVCNATLYRALELAADAHVVGFVHLPGGVHAPEGSAAWKALRATLTELLIRVDAGIVDGLEAGRGGPT